VLDGHFPSANRSVQPISVYGSHSSHMERLWSMAAKLEEKLVARNPPLSNSTILRWPYVVDRDV